VELVVVLNEVEGKEGSLHDFQSADSKDTSICGEISGQSFEEGSMLFNANFFNLFLLIDKI
jgi:hypothetical protein